MPGEKTAYADAPLRGRVALITGGGRGLGRGIALGLAASGSDVVLASRSRDQLDQVVGEVAAAGGRAAQVVADVAEDDTPDRLVAAAVDRFGALDILVHAAGNQARSPALEMTAEQWDAVQRVHLRAAFLLSQAVCRHLVGRGAPGSIVLIGSLTSLRGLAGVLAYGAAKSGVIGLARGLAVELAPRGIRVNVLAPGFFPTDLTRDIDDTPARKRLVERVPMGRQGTPEDLVGAAVFLAGEASAYVTGQILTVDGGWSIA